MLWNKEKITSLSVVSDGRALSFDPWKQVCCGVSDGTPQTIVFAVEGSRWHSGACNTVPNTQNLHPAMA